MLGIAVITSGVLISIFVSFEPHFSSAYRLQFDVLASSLLPYLVYALITASSKSVLVYASGILLVVIHLFLLLQPGLIQAFIPSLSAVYSVPLLLSVLLLPHLYLASKPSWEGHDSA